MNTRIPIVVGAIKQIGVNVPDLDVAREFYRDTIGLKLIFEAPGMLFFQCGDLRLMLSQQEQGHPEYRGSILYFETQDIDVAHQELVNRGVKIVRPPHCSHKTESVEICLSFFEDPFGNLLSLMEQRTLED